MVKFKSEKGITIITLVITVAVMLIILGVVVKDTNLLNKSKQSTGVYKKTQAQEELQIAVTNIYTTGNDNDSNDLQGEEAANEISKEYPEIEWDSKENLTGRYKNFDFKIINKEVIMDTEDKNSEIEKASIE